MALIVRWSHFGVQNQLYKHDWDITKWTLWRGGLWIQVVFKAGVTVITYHKDRIETDPYSTLYTSCEHTPCIHLPVPISAEPRTSQCSLIQHGS